MKIAASIFAAATAQYGAYPNDGAYNDGYNPGKVIIIKKKIYKNHNFSRFFFIFFKKNDKTLVCVLAVALTMTLIFTSKKETAAPMLPTVVPTGLPNPRTTLAESLSGPTK